MLLHSMLRSLKSCPPPVITAAPAPRRARLEPLEARRLLSGDPPADLAGDLAADADAASPAGQVFRGSGDLVVAADPVTTPSVRANPISDPRGDLLPTYTGPVDPGLDVVAHKVTLAGDRLIFFGKMDGPVAPTQDIGALYLFGVDRGRGTPRFLAAPSSPPVIGPNVVWDLIVRVNPDGTGLVNNLAGTSTPLDPADIRINGNHFTASVPLALLTPGATLPPEQWTYNLWPRNGVGRNVQVSDLAPDDGNSPVQVLQSNVNAGHAAQPELAPREVVIGSSGATVAGDPFPAPSIADEVLGTGDGGVAGV